MPRKAAKTDDATTNPAPETAAAETAPLPDSVVTQATAPEPPAATSEATAAAPAAAGPAVAATPNAAAPQDVDAVLSATGLAGAEGRSAASSHVVGGSTDTPAIPTGPIEDFVAPTLETDPDAGGETSEAAIDLINDVALDVKVELGRTHMRVDDVLQLGPGAVVELDKLAGDPVEIFVNERLVARGEVLVLNDDFCVRISEIITPSEELVEG